MWVDGEVHVKPALPIPVCSRLSCWKPRRLGIYWIEVWSEFEYAIMMIIKINKGELVT